MAKFAENVKEMESLGIDVTKTGSVEVQVVLLTKRIEELSKHLKVHAKDFASQRGLFIIVNKRKRFLQYLYRTNRTMFDALLKGLGIRFSEKFSSQA